MLKSMRQASQSWAMRFIIVSLALGMSYMFIDFGQGSGRVARGTAIKVNNEVIARETFNQKLRQMLSRMEAQGNRLPENMRQYVVSQLVSQLVQSELLVQESQDLGLKVSDHEIANRIMTLPYFQKNNRFDPEMYHRYNKLYKFEPEFRRGLESEKFQSLLEQAIWVDREEIKRDYIQENTQVNLAFLSLNPNTLEKHILKDKIAIRNFAKANGPKIEKYYNNNSKMFTIDEKVKPFAKVKDEIAQSLYMQDNLSSKTKEIAKTINDRLKNRQSVDRLLKTYELEWQTAAAINSRSTRFGTHEAGQQLALDALSLNASSPFLAHPALVGNLYYILKFKSRQETSPSELDKIAGEQLMQLQSRYKDEMKSQLTRQWMDHLRSQAKIIVAEDLNPQPQSAPDNS